MNMAATAVSAVNMGTEAKNRSKDSNLYRIELGQLTPHNIKQFRIINQAVFPVTYTEKFYSDILKNSHMCRLAYFSDIVVGGVSYRVDSVPVKSSDDQSPEDSASSVVKKCYIMTLGCLAPYRGLGVGSLMLKHVIRFCQKNPGIRSIYLHVHVKNEVALAFYKRFGFDITGEAPGYYRSVQPQTAFALEKYLSPDDFIESMSDSD